IDIASANAKDDFILPIAKAFFDNLGKASPAIFSSLKDGIVALSSQKNSDYDKSFGEAMAKATSSADLKAIASLADFMDPIGPGGKTAKNLGELLKNPDFVKNYDNLPAETKASVNAVISENMKGNAGESMQRLENSLDSVRNLAGDDKKNAFVVLDALADKIISTAKVDAQAREKQPYVDAVKAIENASPGLAFNLSSLVDGEGATDEAQLKSGLNAADLTKPGDVEGLKKVIAYRFPDDSTNASNILDSKASPEIKKTLLNIHSDMTAVDRDALMNSAAKSIKTKDDLDSFIAAAKGFGLAPSTLDSKIAGIKYDASNNITEGADFLKEDLKLFAKKELKEKNEALQTTVAALPDLEKKYGSVAEKLQTPAYKAALEAAEELRDNILLLSDVLKRDNTEGNYEDFNKQSDAIKAKITKLEAKIAIMDAILVPKKS
ncbi:MAG TPA: hypothetical protein V6C82_07345, partial [Chroococcales cyanobacterium]